MKKRCFRVQSEALAKEVEAKSLNKDIVFIEKKLYDTIDS